MGAIEEHGQHDLDWKEFMRHHGGDIEDAMLAAAADFERENPPKMELARPTWGEVKQAAMKGTVLEFLDELPDSTEMRYWKAVTEEGETVEGFIPTVLPDDGLKVRINGVQGVLYLHPDDEVHLDETEPAPDEADEAEQKRLMEMSTIEVKIVSYNPMNERQLYGISISDEFALSLMEAWKHIDHEGSPCKETAETYLTRFVHQFVGGLHMGNAKKDAL